MMNNKLQMPANYAALSENEQSCVEGGGIVAVIFYALGDMFEHSHINLWNAESKTLEKDHGSVVSRNGNVYTYSDGYTYTVSNGYDIGTSSVGDFFYGIGRIFGYLGL